MKNMLNELFKFLLMGIMTAFAVGYLFNGSIAGGQGLYQGIGNVLKDTDTEVQITLPSLNSSLRSEIPPIMKYASTSYDVNSSIRFKSLFTVITENGEKNGTVEDDFTIYLSDIRNGAGMSVVEHLTTEQIENLEEIPAPFLYDTQTDTLHCHQSGVYVVSVKIYGSNGTQAEYEFQLPIEAG